MFKVTTRSDNVLSADTMGDPEPSKQQQTPTLVTFESLTVPVAAGAVGFLWGAVQLAGPWAAGKWVPFALAVIVTLIFWLNGVTEYKGWNKAVAAFLIALVNAGLIGGAVVGVKSAAPATTNTVSEASEGG